MPPISLPPLFPTPEAKWPILANRLILSFIQPLNPLLSKPFLPSILPSIFSISIHPSKMDFISDQNLHFYSAPSTPIPVGPRSHDHDPDDVFEFETTRIITNRHEFQHAYPDSGWTKGNDDDPQTYMLPARTRSLSVLPLKPPPRLQSPVSISPRSPNSLPKLFPFVRPCAAWNDDFDPFQVALEKVSEETRTRMSMHRRSHSYSAYRTSGGPAHWLDGSVDWTKAQQGLMNRLKPRGPTLAKLMERRETVYLKRVPNYDEPRVEPRSKSSRMAGTETKGDHDEGKKSRSEPSSLKRVVSVVVKYATMKKARKTTSWKLRRCLGYAPGSPPFVK
ncbi:hypothetical protein OSB04_030231 [Centaurea solstitialis]|uniref:Uncharacterized protein n=1 Tax=Centaurea solstitialis TaxID=347529 RepID=A0AA38SEQ4_9ASTR|nr:hypothetical protein OSB04_030231 [Centaurea solstitialis]